jgi:hypothetical protein
MNKWAPLQLSCFNKQNYWGFDTMIPFFCASIGTKGVMLATSVVQCPLPFPNDGRETKEGVFPLELMHVCVFLT